MTNILILGNSHVRALKKAAGGDGRFTVHWLKDKPEDKVGDILLDAAHALIDALAPGDALVLSRIGTMHNVQGLVHHDLPFTLTGDAAGGRHLIPQGTMRADLERRITAREGLVPKLARRAPCPVLHLMPPPPKQHLHLPEDRDLVYRGRSIAEVGFAPAPERLAMWRLEERVLADHLTAVGVQHVPPPPETLTPEGYLHPDYQANDTTHGNVAYGRRVLAQLAALTAARVSEHQ